MFKRFLNGAIWGAGFAAGVLVVLSAGVYVVLNLQLGNRGSTDPVEIGEAPLVRESAGFYGPLGAYSGGFAGHGTVLSAGDGEIHGYIRAEGQGVEGVRIRLALNGVAYSQWAETDAQGKYVIRLSYGEYRIDGYGFDHRTANTGLAGFIGAREGSHTVPPFLVTPDQPGEGLSFDFVRPVRKLGPAGELRLEDPIVLRWEPYAGASHYRVRLHERTGRNTPDRRGVFSWSAEPEVTDTHLDLEPYKGLLTGGRFYSFEIHAYDADRLLISRSPDRWGNNDFWLAR